MDILTELQNFVWAVKHMTGVKNQGADALSRRPDFRRKRCNSTALELTAAGEWVDDIKAGIIDDEWFGPIAHCLANPSPRPPPSAASTEERRLWVAAQRFYLEENGLLWLRGDLEKKEEVGKADMRGRLCIPKMMRRRIFHEAHNTPAGGHSGAARTYLGMNDRYFWKQMWRDTH